MATHTIELDDAEYRALERSAAAAGLSIRGFLRSLITGSRFETSGAAGASRWARLSQRVRNDPPLRDVGDYVRASSRSLREDFALTRDDLEQE